MAPTGGPGRSVRGWASVLRARGERAEASRGVGRAELGQAGGERAGEERELGRGKEGESGPGWAREFGLLGWSLGRVGLEFGLLF